MKAKKTEIEIIEIECSECGYSWEVPLPKGAFPKGTLTIDCENKNCKEDKGSRKGHRTKLRLSPDGSTEKWEPDYHPGPFRPY